MNHKVIPNRKIHETPFTLMDGEKIVKPVFDFLNFLFLRGISKNTIRAYAFDLLIFYRFIRNNHLEVDRLSRQHLTDFILNHRKQNAAPRTINRRLQSVRLFLNHTQGKHWGDHLFEPLTFSPFYKGLKNKALLGPSRLKIKSQKSFSVKVPSVIITPLSPKEINKFISGIRKYRDISITYLMLFCGLRSCEVLSLVTSDIDFIDDHIRVHGKGNKERLIPMPPSVRKTLMFYLDYERPACSHEFVFVVLKGKETGYPLTEAGLRKIFRYRRKSSSLTQAHPHLFRHTFCTNLITQGVSLPVVQKLMGHTDIDITMTYVHMSLADVNKEFQIATQKLEADYDKINLTSS